MPVSAPCAAARAALLLLLAGAAAARRATAPGGLRASSGDDGDGMGASALSLKTKEHDNYVDFDGVTSVAFALDHYSISSGQPFDGVAASGPTTLDVRAGRHGSSGPAADFGAGLSVINVMGLKTGWPHLTLLPDDLNFAVFGNLTLEFADPAGGNATTTATCERMRLAQGHHGTDNNWWLGDNECITLPDSERLLCGRCHPSVEFFAGDDDHTFQVRLTAAAE